MNLKWRSDLQTLQGAMAQRAAELQQAQARAALALRQREQERQRRSFSALVGPVFAVSDGGRRAPAGQAHPPLALQRQRDEALVMHEALSDGFDVQSLLHSDELLSYSRPGVSAEVLRKLRQGEWSLQAQIDLHGLRVDEARSALSRFISESHLLGLRCLRVVHGKGLGSPGRVPVLKGRVLRWLVQKNEVMAFVQARPIDGGAGALLVLLRPLRPKGTNN